MGGHRLAVWGLMCVSAACDVDPWVPYTQNASFDSWCDGIPCDWLLETGDVEPVATWHAGDRAASMIGPEVGLSQLLVEDRSSGAPCLRLEVLVDAPTGTRVVIELDTDDDGLVEWTHDVTARDFEPQSARVAMPETFRSLRVRAVKTGQDDAVLALLRGIQDVADCPETPFEAEIE